MKWFDCILFYHTCCVLLQTHFFIIDEVNNKLIATRLTVISHFIIFFLQSNTQFHLFSFVSTCVSLFLLFLFCFSPSLSLQVLEPATMKGKELLRLWCKHWNLSVCLSHNLLRPLVLCLFLFLFFSLSLSLFLFLSLFLLLSLSLYFSFSLSSSLSLPLVIFSFPPSLSFACSFALSLYPSLLLPYYYSL